MVESCIVIILLSLILFGILQLSILTASHDVVAYAASCGARCAAVGYDDDMVDRAIHVAAIPNLGPAPSMGITREKEMAKNYLLQQNGSLPNYAYSGSIGYTLSKGSSLVKVNLTQHYPLDIPFVGAFYGGDSVTLSSGEVRMMNHAALYLGN